MKLNALLVVFALVVFAPAKDTQHIAVGSKICINVEGSFDNYLITALQKEDVKLAYFDGNDKSCDAATYVLKGMLDDGGTNDKGHHGHNHNSEFTASVRLVKADGTIAWSGTSGKPALAEKTATQLAKEIKKAVR